MEGLSAANQKLQCAEGKPFSDISIAHSLSLERQMALYLFNSV